MIVIYIEGINLLRIYYYNADMRVEQETCWGGYAWYGNMWPAFESLSAAREGYAKYIIHDDGEA